MEQDSTLENLGLVQLGITNVAGIYRNLSTPALYEETVRRREGLIAHLGPIVVKTGHYTGRSPKDKFIVKEQTSEKNIWWGKENKPFDIDKFQVLFHRLLAYLQGKDIFIQDCYAGADEKYRIPIRIITEYAWQNLFARNMFVQISDDAMLKKHNPHFTIFAMPRFHATPEIDGTNSDAFIIVNFGQRLIIIGGTGYAGEIKKAVFTVLNYLLPQEEVLSMHCAANMGSGDDVALFFGLSGTGKTTLSTDIDRCLIGDDEHGWSDYGIFNFEGGCYAKVIRISREHEPQIYQCTRRFGTILENVTINARTRRLNLDDATFTENTRACYPIPHIENALRSGVGPHPVNIFMLSCDAFGVLPAIARLSAEEAAYYFLQGYTARVAGTEIGVREPEAVFSPCFGAPFMALQPMTYARLLHKKIKEQSAQCWLVNTGWIGEGAGHSDRIALPHTRQLIRSTIAGDLNEVAMVKDPVFGFSVPEKCGDIPKVLLQPRNAWKSGTAYEEQLNKLASKFRENFTQFTEDCPPEVLACSPHVG